MKSFQTLTLAVSIATLGFVAPLAHAQTYTKLHSFAGLNAPANPASGFVMSGGVLYGTTVGGGTGNEGTVYKINPDGSGKTTLHNFGPLYQGTNDDGVLPQAALSLSGSTLYGTTSHGGVSGAGTIFKVNTDGTGFTTLYDFSAATGDVFDAGGLITSSNKLFGISARGGSSNNGAIFSLNTDGTGFTVLYSFTDGSDGVGSEVTLVLSGNTLFGMSSPSNGGTGAIFSINTDGTGFTILQSFTGTPGTLLLSGSTLYGTNGLSIFSIKTDGSGYTTIDSPPEVTSAPMVLSGSTLYGVSPNGGTTQNGSVFSLNVNGSGFTILHSFSQPSSPSATNSDGAFPVAPLAISGSTLYGVTEDGGTGGGGALFSINTNGTSFTNIHSFSGVTDPGAYPEAPLISSSNTLYGTTSAGPGYIIGAGSVFKINSDGTGYATVYNFGGNGDGANPMAGLVLSGKTLYGTASQGGGSSNGANGTVFKVNTDGTGFTVLYSFTGNNDGAYPETGLVLSGGTLYGTSQFFNVPDDAAIFKIKTDGTGFTVLHDFTESDGFQTTGGLTLSGSTLYGVTQSTVFKINTDGTGYTILHTFQNDGSVPQGTLILSGGTLYGMTSGGGTHGFGTIFSISTSGANKTVLYNFTGGNDGEYPFGGLTLSGTTLLGTTSGGGADGFGTIFKVSTTGTGFTSIPFASVINGVDADASLLVSGTNVYGTTRDGGNTGQGTVFSLSSFAP